MKELAYLPAHTLREKLVKREINFSDILLSLLKNVEEKEKRLNSFITLNLDRAMEEAKKLDREKNLEALSPLRGIPIAVKDNNCTEGILTTCGSRILANFSPPYDATVIERIKKAGMIIVGKTNMDEFAMGSSTENSAFGPTRNPWDEKRVPGGSSGGSAAAISAGETILALGSDTGGSIRQPSSFCNVTGLKPTYGRVSRYGLVAFASSLDQIGPMGKDVEDVYELYKLIGGYDPRDSTSLPGEPPHSSLTGEVKGKVLGIPREYLSEGVEEEVLRVVEEAKKIFQSLGMELREVSLPHTSYAVATYYIIAPSEASSNLARYDGVHYGYREEKFSPRGNPVVEMMETTRDKGFGSEVKRRIMLGTYALSRGYFEEYYLKAQKVRSLIKRDFEEAWKTCDALLTPVSPTPPFLLGERIQDPLTMYLSDIFTIPVNLAGLPALSIPGGFTRDGLPVGIQLIGKPLDEFTLLDIGYAFQRETDFHKKVPPSWK